MQEHEKWLQIAKEDLLAAKNLVNVELFSAIQLSMTVTIDLLGNYKLFLR
jgi:hypothetical protein